MKKIFIPVSVSERLPSKTGYYFTTDKVVLKYFVNDKQWWYDGIQYRPKIWLEEKEITDELFELINRQL